ncbi:MAG: hypothetical protein HY608_08900, partial [Planctomycetes bacterium]|nr:hypothetical protein [Planctomycetota bacterium]
MRRGRVTGAGGAPPHDGRFPVVTPRRRVLVLSYFFPPAGGVASVRVSSWTRLLPEFGWEATVVAALSPDAPVRDAALGIGEGTEAIRAGEIPLRRLLQRLKWLGVPARALDGAVDRIWPDPFVGWAPFAHAAASRRLREGGIDAILSVSNPFTPHWIGLRLAGRARLPWVAFFSDDMSRNPDPRIRPRARSLRSLERAVLERADGVAA